MSITDKYELIVQKLAQIPFHKKMTLITLTETLKDPQNAIKLLQMVTDIIRPVSLSEETPLPKPTTLEEIAISIADFASCVCFPIDSGVTIDKQGFAQQLLLENSEKLVELMAAVLSDISEAKKKAYIAKFKQQMIIPHEIQQQENIQQALTQLRAAQSKFQTSYNENQEVLQSAVSQKIEALTTEKQQLITREDKLSALVKQLKMKNVPEEAVNLSKRRRENMGEIQQLQEQINGQNEVRKALLNRAQAVVNSAKGTPASIIEACQNESRRLKQELINLPQEIQEKEQLRELIMQDPSDEIISQMELEMEQAKKDLIKLKELNNINGENDDNQQQESQVTYLRQQLAKFKRKHQDLLGRMEKVSQDSSQVDVKMRSLMSTTVTLDNIDAADELPLIVFKDLINKGKAMKAQMGRFQEDRNYLKKEYAVLTRTVEILTQICSRYGADISEEQTTTAMMNTQNLHEARQLLQEIEQAIKQKRNTLQPRMNELQECKRNCASLENNLQQQRQRVKQLDASRQGGIYKLRMTMQKAENECQSLVSEIFKIEKMINLYKLEVERAESEKSFIGLKKEIMIAQAGVKTKIADLRQKQAQVKEGLPNLVEQKKMFSDLVMLLKAKQEHSKRIKEETANENGNGEQIKIM
ncbi:Intraflagellar transport protein 81 [Spironucleus salmonicida]|uniref:Intraflagellar transport protein 81 n=1 Tax=Spironucleus salmonicida TaxID=348837 RepID=V6LJI5_9EUKA|nr:Intraflagellar transport protein 81 [Spironucleus salmonicida]|eukprot:EST43876.1 Intraflagellar transport protein 81 [Spironucleus salmonicida]